jgi:hypothetical protein
MVDNEEFGWRIRTAREQQEVFDRLWAMGYALDDIEDFHYHYNHLVSYIGQKVAYIHELQLSKKQGTALPALDELVDGDGDLHHRIQNELDKVMIKDMALCGVQNFGEICIGDMSWERRVGEFYARLSDGDRWRRNQQIYSEKCLLTSAGANNMFLGKLLQIAGSISGALVDCVRQNICTYDHAFYYTVDSATYTIQHYFNDKDNLGKFRDLIDAKGTRVVIAAQDWHIWVSSNGENFPPEDAEVFGLCFYAGFFEDVYTSFINSYMPDEFGRDQETLHSFLSNKRSSRVIIHSKQNMDALRLLYSNYATVEKTAKPYAGEKLKEQIKEVAVPLEPEEVVVYVWKENLAIIVVFAALASLGLYLFPKGYKN